VNPDDLRAVIALDPAAPLAEVFEALIALSERAPPEVEVVFVEDDNLLRLASLPGMVEVAGYAHSAPRALPPDRLRMQLDERAARIRRACEHARLELSLQSRFTILRGEVVDSLLRVAAGADLLVVGRSLRSAGLRTWLGAAPEQLAARFATTGGAASLMFVHEPWRTGRCILRIDPADGEPAALSRHLAEGLGRREGLPVEAIELPAAGEPAALNRWLREQCSRFDPRVLVLPLTGIGERLALTALLEDLPASVLISR
jgi:nucleotide-binding universal stress UspA family protein